MEAGGAHCVRPLPRTGVQESRWFPAPGGRVWLRGFSDRRPLGHTDPRGRGTNRPSGGPSLYVEADRTGQTDNQSRAQPSESKQAFLSSSPGPRPRADGREAPYSGAALVPVAPPPSPPLGAVPFSHQTWLRHNLNWVAAAC